MLVTRLSQKLCQIYDTVAENAIFEGLLWKGIFGMIIWIINGSIPVLDIRHLPLCQLVLRN